MLKDQQIRALFKLMATAKPTARANIQYIYLNRLGAEILPYLLEFYPHEPMADIRKGYISTAVRYAQDKRAVELAAMALSDRAESVRYMAIGLFACTLDKSHIGALEQHAAGRPQDSIAVAKAIEAIRREDHNLYVSLDHPSRDIASIQWDTRALGTNDYLDKDKFQSEVELYIEKYAPETVPELKRILGPLFK